MNIIFGLILPWIMRVKIPLNTDGSIIDTGQFLVDDEVGFYYARPWAFCWLGFVAPLTRSSIYHTADDSVEENPPFKRVTK